MKFQDSKKHIIDIIFPITLFFVFAVSALITTLLAANFYRSTTDRSEEIYNARTPLSYITEKIRQNDINGAVYIDTVDGHDCLIMEQDIDTVIYKTYIYNYDGVLKELFVKGGSDLSLASGKDIIPVKNFSMQMLSKELFEFTVTNNNGSSESITIGIRSSQREEQP